jgi:hypothetical protein
MILIKTASPRKKCSVRVLLNQFIVPSMDSSLHTKKSINPKLIGLVIRFTQTVQSMNFGHAKKQANRLYSVHYSRVYM